VSGCGAKHTENNLADVQWDRDKAHLRCYPSASIYCEIAFAFITPSRSLLIPASPPRRPLAHHSLHSAQPPRRA
jgi:hypothetical protein